MAALIERGTRGTKSGGGFFRSENKKPFVLDPKTQAYVAASEVKLPDLKYIDEICLLHHIGRYEEAMAAFVAAPGDEAALARKVIAGYLSYAFHRAGEVTESITGIDLIMGFGFNWAPPSVLVDTIGVRPVVAMIQNAGLPVPKILATAAERDAKSRFFTHQTANVGRFFVAG
jgi:3-hydroxyacyl-CoA dehydrogenase